MTGATAAPASGHPHGLAHQIHNHTLADIQNTTPSLTFPSSIAPSEPRTPHAANPDVNLSLCTIRRYLLPPPCTCPIYSSPTLLTSPQPSLAPAALPGSSHDSALGRSHTWILHFLEGGPRTTVHCFSPVPGICKATRYCPPDVLEQRTLNHGTLYLQGSARPSALPLRTF